MAWVHLLQDRGDGAGGPAGKSSRGASSDRIQFQQLHGRASGAVAAGNPGRHGEVCGPLDFRQGREGPKGTNVVRLQYWILRYGDASSEFRKIVTSIMEWLANSCPPWAAYQALITGRLIGLDKQPGLRPVGISKTWRRCSAK